MLPNKIAEQTGPVIIQILESLKHEGVTSIEEINLEDNYDAKLIHFYLVGTQELPDVPMSIFEGISENNGQPIYVFLQNNGEYSIIFASEFSEILEDIKYEKITSVINGGKFAKELDARNLNINTLKELPIIPHNIKSTALSTDVPQVEFTDAYRIYQIKFLGSNTVDFTIKFSEKGEYAFYENVNSQKRKTRSRTISQVYPDVKEVELGGKSLIQIDSEELRSEHIIKFKTPRES